MDTGRASAPASRDRDHPQRSRRRLVWWVLLAVLFLLAVLAVVSAQQARAAQAHLRSAEDRVPQLRERLMAGDEAGLQETVKALQHETGAARRAVDGPQWSVLAAFPVVGASADAVQTVTEVADNLATGALADFADAAGVLDPQDLKPANGRIALAPIRAARPHVEASASSVRAADQRLNEIETDSLLTQLREPVTDVTSQVSKLRSTMDSAEKAARLLPDLLGAHGPRRYLFLVENNSEPRALGGLTGSLIVLQADHGRIRLVEQRPASSFDGSGDPVKLTSGERALYGPNLRLIQNVTGTPDFPRAAQLAGEMWSRETGQHLDGVAAIDPVALGALLRATGPVALPGGERLSEANAARTLLNRVYFDLPDPDKQDEFFTEAASVIFREVTSGNVDVAKAAEALGEATTEGRFLFWSSREPEQSVLSGTALAGELRGEQDGSPVVGVYLHDRTQAKIAYYEDMDVHVVSRECRGNGSQSLTASVKITSRVPDNISAMGAQTGGGVIVPEGQIASQVYLYAPSGAEITNFRISAGARTVTTHAHNGLQVASKRVDLRPGESVTLEYDIESRSDLPGAVRVRSTPGPARGQFSVSTFPCTQ